MTRGDPTAVEDAPAMRLFRQEWRTYRKIMENNYMFHREVYGRLHELLSEEVRRPFRFLDIACGDATASVQALAGTSVSHYFGIDLSEPALELARVALRVLACPATVERRDFVEALADWDRPVDITWFGQSLHHLSRAGKLVAMRHCRRTTPDDGLFLIWEPASPDSESRDGWVARFEETCEVLWAALTREEWGAMLTYVRTADFPETSSAWQALGREAGFSGVRELFVAPANINRMYCFQA
jgi:hypothetical protein